eukprot:CAMPEP_0185841164 /NCGR_PEP_ID=MMETSP1353-20130828/17457_1 /TAXON_ID=1077150 /ORGANISM="Erythrolobus australicus, Strain CCMP3124" /LENGTH=131 /DNA_ID=CAMNT_0028540583 /DNA_START=573 /DNA_END=964 /DNA_ORIENTATION=-
MTASELAHAQPTLVIFSDVTGAVRAARGSHIVEAASMRSLLFRGAASQMHLAASRIVHKSAFRRIYPHISRSAPLTRTALPQRAEPARRRITAVHQTARAPALPSRFDAHHLNHPRFVLHRPALQLRGMMA